MHYDQAITWRSGKKILVAFSTAESDYITMAQTMHMEKMVQKTCERKNIPTTDGINVWWNN